MVLGLKLLYLVSCNYFQEFISISCHVPLCFPFASVVIVWLFAPVPDCLRLPLPPVSLANHYVYFSVCSSPLRPIVTLHHVIFYFHYLVVISLSTLHSFCPVFYLHWDPASYRNCGTIHLLPTHNLKTSYTILFPLTTVCLHGDMHVYPLSALLAALPRCINPCRLLVKRMRFTQQAFS